MAAVVRNKSPRMTLYASSDPKDIIGHCIRFALAEKQVGSDVIYVTPDSIPEDFIELNPYGNLPALVDRTLMINHPDIIFNYLDERFPHPPLYPIYPIAKAQSRLMVYRMQEDWFSIFSAIDAGLDQKIIKKKIHALFLDLIKIAPSFEEHAYFMSNDFSVVDCYAAPFFWRFQAYGLEFPPQAKLIKDYCDRIFVRNSFQASLSEEEYELTDIYDDVI
jgi:stringent starvation protein A